MSSQIRYCYTLVLSGMNVSITSIFTAVKLSLRRFRSHHHPTFPSLASVKFNLKLGIFNTLQKVPEEFEIVFCSMDRSEEEYNNFSSKMSWWCLPYAIPSLPKLIMDYKAHSLPHLVVIDTDGKTITMDGVQSLTVDPVGKSFPWRRIRIVDLMPTQYIMHKDGVSDSKYPFPFLDDKYLMLYFAARSDDLSKEFTPWLTKAYNILKGKRGDDFEVCLQTACALYDAAFYVSPFHSLKL